MRVVSLCKWRSLPKPCIQSGSPERAGLLLGLSFSCRASLTNCLSVWLRSAAFDLALRKRASGISMVVFIGPYYHIYGKWPTPWSTESFSSVLLLAGGSSRTQIGWDEGPRTE